MTSTVAKKRDNINGDDRYRPNRESASVIPVTYLHDKAKLDRLHD